MQTTSVLETVRAFIVETFLFGEGEGLGNADSFLDGGILDSTGILELVSFLEETYKISVSDSELTPDNLDSIERVAAFVQAKHRALSAGDARA